MSDTALQTAEIISVALRPMGWSASVRNEPGLREQALGHGAGGRAAEIALDHRERASHRFEAVARIAAHSFGAVTGIRRL